MRVISNASTMRIVHHGKKWEYDVDPCSRTSMAFLERNEAVVSWLQPFNSNTITDQVPCIIVGDSYCSLSLRMMKVPYIIFSVTIIPRCLHLPSTS